VNSNYFSVAILAGGKGSRLWPLSIPSHPKPFVELGALGTLYANTMERAASLNPMDIFTIAEPSLENLCAREGVSFIAEPAPRNTAGAVALAGVASHRRLGEEGVVLVLPADHWIPDLSIFRETVRRLTKTCMETGRLGLMGISPSGPETGYGYIEQGDSVGDAADVRRFVEKPDRETAASMLRQGGFVWNSGMFVLPVSVLKEEMDRHCPGLWRAAEEWAADGADRSFLDLDPVPIDIALMEKTDRVVVTGARFGWSDVGNFRSLHAILSKDENGNAGWGPGRVEDCRDSLVITRRPETLVRNLDGMAYIQGKGGDLAVSLSDAEKIRGGVERILAKE